MMQLAINFVATEPLYIIGALSMGAIIGLIELFFVHADERGLGWLSHGLHAIPVAMIFTFIAMNVNWFMIDVIGWKAYNGNVALEAGIRVLIGLIATFKVKAAAAVIQGHNSVGEKLGHAFIVGALIAASPYIWAFVQPNLPLWMRDAPTVAKTVGR